MPDVIYIPRTPGSGAEGALDALSRALAHVFEARRKKEEQERRDALLKLQQEREERQTKAFETAQAAAARKTAQEMLTAAQTGTVTDIENLNKTPGGVDPGSLLGPASEVLAPEVTHEDLVARYAKFGPLAPALVAATEDMRARLLEPPPAGEPVLTPETLKPGAKLPTHAGRILPTTLTVPGQNDLATGASVPARTVGIQWITDAMAERKRKRAEELEQEAAKLRQKREIEGPPAPTTRNIGGREKGWNPQTRDFDIDYGPAGNPPGAGVTPQEMDALVDGVLAGNISATDLGRSNMRATVLARAAQREKGFTSQTYQARARMRSDFSQSGPGTAGGQMDSLNQLADHLSVLQDAANALANKNTRAINVFINKVREQFGDSSITNYETAALAVSEEVARILKGGVAGEHEGEAWEKKFAPNAAPAQQLGAIATTRRLIHGRLNAKRQKWTAVMGKDRTDEFYDFLEPAARTMFEGAGGTPAAGTTGAANDPLGIR